MNHRIRIAEDQIRETLEKYGEAFNDNTVWRVQGNPVISHKALERIAAKADVKYEKPVIVRAERDEAVILVSGTLGDRLEWSIGEALIDVNYRVSGRQAAYVWAMAEKRAKDRVILKLVNLHGLLYSEEEADEFKQGRPQVNAAQQNDAPPHDEFNGDTTDPNPRPKSSAQLRREDAWGKITSELYKDLLDCHTLNGLSKLKDHYRERARAEGWNRAYTEQLKEIFETAEQDISAQEAEAEAA